MYSVVIAILQAVQSRDTGPTDYWSVAMNYHLPSSSSSSSSSVSYSLTPSLGFFIPIATTLLLLLLLCSSSSVYKYEHRPKIHLFHWETNLAISLHEYCGRQAVVQEKFLAICLQPVLCPILTVLYVT